MRKSRKMQKLIERMAKKRKVDLSEVGASFKSETDSFMDLHVKTVAENLIRVAHYYEQYGDKCADPEVVFLVGCDGEWYPIEWITPKVVLNNRVLGGFKKYVEVDAENGTWIRANMNGQRDLAIFANKWADNLRRQGFK